MKYASYPASGAGRLSNTAWWLIPDLGIWPIVAYPSFEAVTGRKREPWLVKTVGLLAIVTGVHRVRSSRVTERPAGWRSARR